MGLDMYLTKRTYVKNWEHMAPDERHEIIVRRGGKERTDIKPERISEIVEDVAYWRKANAIHKWFVEWVQDGEDNCGEYLVTVEQLSTLVSLCKQVLASVETVDGEIHESTSYNPDGSVVKNTRPGQVVAQQELAAGMLPTQSGFFFGSTDYDEYYLKDLADTVEQLEPLLSDSDCDYYYHSSW